MLLFGQDNCLPTYPDSPLNWFSIFLKRHGLTQLPKRDPSRIASQSCSRVQRVEERCKIIRPQSSVFATFPENDEKPLISQGFQCLSYGGA